MAKTTATPPDDEYVFSAEQRQLADQAITAWLAALGRCAYGSTSQYTSMGYLEKFPYYSLTEVLTLRKPAPRMVPE